MAGPGATVVARPDEPMDSVAGRLNDHKGSIVLVVGDGRLVGVIEPADVDRFFRGARAS
jgi:CBS domain-containing protein